VQLKFLSLLPALLLVGSPAHAGLDAEEQAAGLRFEVFTDSDDVHVYSQGGLWKLDLAQNSDLSVGVLREVVVVPGITAPPGSQEAVDAISGASRPIATASDPYTDWSKTRMQLDTSARWHGVSGGYYASKEEDYFAQQLSGGVERPLFDENLVLAFGGSWGWDRIDPLEDLDTSVPADRKTTLHGDVVATWTADPLTVFQGGVEMSQVEGIQHNPYRTVYVAGAYVPELHPDSRNRRDVFLKVNRYLPGHASLKLDYKFYADDWGVVSHTAGAKLLQYIGQAVVVRYRYRYYAQGAADFWRDDYVTPGGVNGYQTADYRLGNFDAHLFGSQVTWSFGRAPFSIDWLGNLGLNVEYERYFNTNNFSANLFQMGLSLTY
jgi:hypothetical protein